MPIIIEPTEQEKKFIAEHCIAVNGLMDFIRTGEPTDEHINGPYKIRKFRLADGVFLHYVRDKEPDLKSALKSGKYTQFAVFNTNSQNLDEGEILNRSVGIRHHQLGHPNLSFRGNGNIDMQFTSVKGNMGSIGYCALENANIRFINLNFVEEDGKIKPKILQFGGYQKFDGYYLVSNPITVGNSLDYWSNLEFAARRMGECSEEVAFVKAYKSAATGKQ